MRSNIQVLIAQKSQRDGRRFSLRSLAADLKISRYTIYAFAHNKLEEYPVVMLEKLCTYFDCEISDLLTLVEAPDNA